MRVEVKASESRELQTQFPRRGPERSTPSTVSLALLDRAGVIVSVNRAWREFTLHNGGDPAKTGVGMRFLDVCAAADNDAVAEQVAEAVQAALNGDLPAPMSIRVPCHRPDQERWFDELISSRFTDDGVCVGATVSLSPTMRTPVKPHRTTDAMLDHAVSRLVDAQSLLDGLANRLDAEVDRLTLTAIVENLDAVIRDLRPRQQWRR
jgi:hypothetical protein